MSTVGTTSSFLPRWAEEALNITYNNFTKLRSEYVPDVNCSVVYLKHKTGVTVVIVTPSPSETESAFEVAVPTYVSCDGGAPHIIEHVILGGSESFPDRKAFSLLLRDRFDTYLNADAYRDCTSYFFATVNDTFFKRTAHYFLETVFRPKFLTDDRILKQEACHLVVVPDTGSTNHAYEYVHHDRRFSFTGVVYNEMKIRNSFLFNQVNYLVFSYLHKNAYRYNCKGDPNCIPHLTYDFLVSFYKKFYKPSRANVYVYSSKDIYDKLNYLDNYFCSLDLNSYTPDEGRFSIPLEEQRFEHIKARHPYDSNASVGDVLITAWLLDPVNKSTGDTVLSNVERVAWKVLEYLLIRSHKSLFHTTLLPYTKNLYPGSLELSHQQAVFLIGAEGFHYGDTSERNETTSERFINEFTTLVDTSLDQQLRRRFNPSELLAAINTVEFKFKELPDPPNPAELRPIYPRGMQLIRNMRHLDVHGRDGIEALKFTEIFKFLRTQTETGYFESLVSKRLLQNQHRVTIHFYPSSEFAENSKKAFQSSIKSFVEKMDLEQVLKAEQEYHTFLKESSETTPSPPSVSKPLSLNIPTKMSLSNISRHPRYASSSAFLLNSSTLTIYSPESAGVPVLLNLIPSDDILYLDLAYSLRNLRLNELQKLKVLTKSWRDSVSDQLEQSFQVHLGGVSVDLVFDSPFTHTKTSSKAKYPSKHSSLGFLVVRVKCLSQNFHHALDLTTHFLKVRATANKHKNALFKLYNSLNVKIANRSDMYATMVTESHHSVTGLVNELTSGFSFLKYLQTLIQSSSPVSNAVHISQFSPSSHQSTDHCPLSNGGLKSPNTSANQPSNTTEFVDTVEQVDVNELSLLLEKVLKPENLIISISGSTAEETVLKNLSRLSSFVTLNTISNALDHYSLWSTEARTQKTSELFSYGISNPSPNNCLSVGGPLLTEFDDFGSNFVFTHFLTTKILFTLVREKGGAYGVLANLVPSGSFYVTSFADPNIYRTCDIIYNLSKILKEELTQLTNESLETYKVGALASLDRLGTNSDRALSSLRRFVTGETSTVSQLIRDTVFDTTVEDFKRFADTLANATSTFSVAIVGNKDQILDQTSSVEKLFNKEFKLLFT